MDCPDDATLAQLIEGATSAGERARLLAHVEMCDACHALIAAASAEDDPRRALHPGDEIGRYRVVGLVGAGGMGAVYRAHDRELARDVALKVIRSDIAGDAAALRERLRGEARALAKVTSPFVVHVYEVGELGNATGDLFLAMELVDGPTLRGWLATPRSPHEIAAVFASCARGLAAAHDAGVIHRDFKPDNVIIGSDGRPRIGDFGLAASAGSGSAEVAGTLPYLAPEVRRGAPASPASDQWSLCVALAEAILGHRPDRDLSDLPAPIRRIVARGLDHDPRRRAPSLHAVAHALSAIANPRSRAWLAIGTVLMLGAIGGTYAIARSRGRACDLPSLPAVWTADDRAAVARAFQGAAPDRAGTALAAVERSIAAWTAAWEPERAAACPDRGRATCLELQQRRVAAILRLFQTADRSLVERAPAIVASLPDPGACVHAPVRVEPSSPARLALEARLVEARALFDVGRFADAATAATQSFDAAVTARDDELALEARLVRAYARRDANQTALAAEDFRAATATAIARDDARSLAEALIGQADTQVMLDDPAAHAIAADAAEGAIEKLGHDGELSARLARSRCRIGAHRPTELARGARDCEEARRLYVALRGPAAPELAHVENNLGLIAYLQGRYQEAAGHFAVFGELSERYHGASYHNVDTARVNRADTLVHLGALDEAEALYAGLQGRRPEWISVWDGAGLLYRRRGDHARAAAMYGHAADLAARQGNPGAECSERLGLAEVALDAGDAAQPLVARAAAACMRASGADQGRLALVRSRALAAAGDRAGARQAADDALAALAALVPAPGGPDDQIRDEIVRWQATLR